MQSFYNKLLFNQMQCYSIYEPLISVTAVVIHYSKAKVADVNNSNVRDFTITRATKLM